MRRQRPVLPIELGRFTAMMACRWTAGTGAASATPMADVMRLAMPGFVVPGLGREYELQSDHELTWGSTSTVLGAAHQFHDPPIEWNREGNPARVPLFRGATARSSLAARPSDSFAEHVRVRCACPRRPRDSMPSRRSLADRRNSVDSACSNLFTDVDCPDGRSYSGCQRSSGPGAP